MKYQYYIHHSEYVPVWVRRVLKGKHRKFCLCHDCSRFNPGTKEHCFMAQQIYCIDISLEMVTPVWGCPRFIRRSRPSLFERVFGALKHWLEKTYHVHVV